MNERVLVLGGGVGGNVVAAELRRLLPPEHRITVVERSDTFVLGASLLRLIVGEARPEDVTRAIAGLSRQGIEVVIGEVERIDPEARRVTVGARQLEADHLVVALGADLDAAAIAGLVEAGHSFYALEGAVALRDALARFDGGRIVVLTAAPAYKCPAAPYEAAMLIEGSLRRRGVRGRSSIDLYAAEPAPMGVAGPAVSAAVRGLLGAKGIAYHPEHQVVRADASARRLHFSSGASTDYDLLAFVAPHRAPRAVREAGLTGESGWIPVDRATLRTRFERVWAIGDVTGIPLKMGKPLPKAATFARGEAEVVARAIASEVTGGEPAGAYAGMGECWVETGGGMAAFGHGDFFAEPTPAVSLEPPGVEAHRAKEAWEREWLGRWG
ncbi:FAD-dependent pyridine nucleotide-disulphide oxidoreductase [Anaeromyxobacter dehalogenans 2CP-1]|uniref:FAD-dependent pyridine nucleotide-disulphide oxidoreductase n=1 Tax=Anaeromyxobacter dehalogenans (strain ATCC BAA-258 / DSM 21875 / 2CP-1) TaxID=455488 RepID=B8JG09_ANAD2|nr:FAD/NAD(P)-binding oxidoreductase [Anaeromyxobacter dehalogenans]ACL66412.1 FAD-dependent pyridine nucleotide-disulphide oxidoreductase [Anaeromyxobacter dehalogenans 2CP-1]